MRQGFGMRVLFIILIALGLASAARGEVVVFAATGEVRRLVIYSTLDIRLVQPLIAAFQAQNPGVAVEYEDLLAAEIAQRVVAETDAAQATADFVFSSAMDQQMKLANDGYAQPVRIAANWPRWANWRDTAFALTFEPAVLVYHKPSFPDGPPLSRLQLIEWLRQAPLGMHGRIGTYDIERSAVGYLYLARDAEHFADIWTLLQAMAETGLQTFATSQEIIDGVADGRLVLGYNVLGSYAADQTRLHPNLGIVQFSDFTVVVSRVGLVPRAAASPDLGAAFMDFLTSVDGQTLLADRLRLPAVSLGLNDADTAAQLRPVPVSPGLLAYLDQAKRRGMIHKWRDALALPN
jgi:iron(III) transport system substrate-binding protein